MNEYTPKEHPGVHALECGSKGRGYAMEKIASGRIVATVSKARLIVGKVLAASGDFFGFLHADVDLSGDIVVV